MEPDTWRKCQVSDICTLKNGHSFKPSQWDVEGLPIIRIQNLNGSDNFNYYSGEVKEAWLVETGQLLFSWAGTRGVSFGPFVWNKQLGVLNQHIYKVDESEGVSKEWLYEALKWVTNKIEAQAHGFKATLLHVQKKDIDNQSIDVPPLPEQRKIAKILSTWDKAIATTEKLISASKQQKKALMQQLLTGKKRLVSPETGRVFEGEWEEVRLGDLQLDISDGNYSSKYPKQSDFLDAGVPFLRANNLRNGGISELDMRYISELQHEEITKGHLKKGDVLISTRGELGNVALVPDKHIGSNINAQLVRINAAGKLNNLFLFYLLLWARINKKYDALSTGTALKQLPVGKLKKLTLVLPVLLLEQQKIAQVLTAADQEIEHLESKLAYFQQEKKALMKQLLTGKRRVKVDSEIEAV